MDIPTFHCPSHFCAFCKMKEDPNHLLMQCTRCTKSYHPSCCPSTICPLNSSKFVCIHHRFVFDIFYAWILGRPKFASTDNGYIRTTSRSIWRKWTIWKVDLSHWKSFLVKQMIILIHIILIIINLEQLIMILMKNCIHQNMYILVLFH